MKLLAAALALSTAATLEAFQVTRPGKTALSAYSSTRLFLDSTRELGSNHDGDRRAFLLAAAASASASFLAVGLPIPSYAASKVDYKAVSSDIADLIKKNPDWGE